MSSLLNAGIILIYAAERFRWGPGVPRVPVGDTRICTRSRWSGALVLEGKVESMLLLASPISAHGLVIDLSTKSEDQQTQNQKDHHANTDAERNQCVMKLVLG